MSAGGSLFAGTPSNSVLPSYCVITENSLSQAQVENAGAASMFLKNMLPLMTVLQFLFIVMAPLAAFTMVMAGAQGMTMFVKYIMFGLWTQSWLPVAVMLNDYAQITLAHTLGVLGQAVTGVSANITTASTSVTLASMPPPPPNGLTLTTIPTVLNATMQALSNADMLLAMTPIITMIVFTGSYMAMSQLASGMGGEDKVDRNMGQETPSVATQEAMHGVQASGNPLHGEKYAATAAMDGVGINTTSALNASLGATVSSAATHAQAAKTDLALTSMNAAAERLTHSDGRAGTSGTTVDGTQGSKVSGQHSQGVKTMDSTGNDTRFMANAAYTLALDNVLKSPGAAQMTPAQKQAAAEKETAEMLQNPATLASAATKAGWGGLANMARGFSTGLQAEDAGTVAQKAAREVGDTLNSSNDAGVVTKLTGGLNLSSQDQKAIESSKQVQDAMKTSKSADDDYKHVEQIATQASTSAGAGVSQNLSGKQLLSVLQNATRSGDAYLGGQKLLSGTSHATQSLYQSNYDKGVAAGLSREQSAVTAYASTINSVQANPNGDGVTALKSLFSQPSAIGMNASLGQVVPMLGSVSDSVNAMKENTAMTPGEQQRAEQLGKQANTLPGQAKTATAGAAHLSTSTPEATAAAGMKRAAAFGSGAENQVAAATAPKVSEGAYKQKVDQNPSLKQAADNNNTPLAQLAQLEARHPNAALVGLAAANGVAGFLNDLNKELGQLKKGPVVEGGGGGEPIPGGGEPGAPEGRPRQAPGEPSSPKPGIPEGGPKGGAPGGALPHPTSSPDGGTYEQVIGKDGNVVGRAVVNDATGKFTTEAAAKEAMSTAFKDAGAKFVAKTSAAQAVAETAVATGTPVGDLVAVAVEGGMVVMNADLAATVLETGTAMVNQYGPAKATELMAGVAKDAAQSIAANANAGAAAARANVAASLGIPSGPGGQP